MIHKIQEAFAKVFPKMYLKLRYHHNFGKFPDLKNPKTLNEKILYLTLNNSPSQKQLWVDLADKYKVREYVKKTLGSEDNLVKLYGKWEKAEDIDFDSLPDKFVLKVNHGCGDAHLIKDKQCIDKENIKSVFNRFLKNKYGITTGEYHYQYIKPLIIAEELLENDAESAKISSSIIDYKFWCFNGKCEFIFAVLNRTKNSIDEMLFDRNWQPVPEFIKKDNNCNLYQGEIPKPSNFNELIEIAEKLAAPFPVVRVDLYNINGRILFGEMTFTSAGGTMHYFTDEFQKLAGSLINL